MHRSRIAILTLISCLSVAGIAGAATLRVCASGCTYTGLQQAVDAAQPGDTILLRAGETFVGHVTLRKKSGTTDILIRSDAADSDVDRTVLPFIIAP